MFALYLKFPLHPTHTSKQSNRDAYPVPLNYPSTTHTPANNPVRGLIGAKGNCHGIGPTNNCFYQSNYHFKENSICLGFKDINLFLSQFPHLKNTLSSFEEHSLKYSM